MVWTGLSTILTFFLAIRYPFFDHLFIKIGHIDPLESEDQKESTTTFMQNKKFKGGESLANTALGK